MYGKILCYAILLGCFVALNAYGDDVLVEIGPDFDLASVDARDAQVRLVEGGKQTGLRVATGHQYAWPGITLRPTDGLWDLSRFGYLTTDIQNVGTDPIQVHCRVDSQSPSDQPDVYFQQGIELSSGETRTVSVMLKKRIPTELSDKLFGMRGYPGGLAEDQGIDPSRVERITFFIGQPNADHAFRIGTIRAAGSVGVTARLLDEGKLFPMIDRFGQYVHKDWPGKTHSVDDLRRQKGDEAADLIANPGPEGWNQYGGWAEGPKLEATGYFRVEKYRERWWLIDPTGCLFWSHGIDCVRPNTATTPITDREHWFEELPRPGSLFARFLGRGAWAPRGYYHGKPYRTYDFTGANLQRKYGDDWPEESARLAHRRLRSWGMNTIANWSSADIYLSRRTPYVGTIHVGAKPIQGSTGYWKQFPDVFDPNFTATLDARMALEVGKSAGDPWCIGYFVHNELSWGDELSLATATLASPPEQAAKRIFVDDLKTKYGPIESLNRAWATEHVSWQALLESQEPPDRAQAADDLTAFAVKTARTYFRKCRDAVKKVAPASLYLGCRFAWSNDGAVRAAAEYCDVISFNRYRYSVADLTLPEGIDRPTIIGEFHFGALDRGMFHTGLRAAIDQNERAGMYADYVKGALANPYLVGTHWFQYADQATTGRGDGENYQIGFLDVCDTPYPETIRASREVGAEMYRYRLEGR